LLDELDSIWLQFNEQERNDIEGLFDKDKDTNRYWF
jgi:hypothetical protein